MRLRLATSITGLIMILGILLPVLCAAKAPTSIAGIALGSKVQDYPDIVQTNFMREVVVTDWHGFRKGIISYGECKYKGEILKINMKYDDKSKRFYEKLLKRYKESFGEPSSWQGDSFGNVRIWKWFFVDENGDDISLTLQFNGKNSRETIGNVVRLSYPKKMEEERLCFNEMCEMQKMQTEEARKQELQKSDWSHLIPQ